jgi:hypothetical protein
VALYSSFPKRAFLYLENVVKYREKMIILINKGERK